MGEKENNNNLNESPVTRWFRNAVLGATMADLPAMMTASGWRLNEKGDYVLDQQNDPHVKLLRDNLAAEGAGVMLGEFGIPAIYGLYNLGIRGLGKAGNNWARAKLISREMNDIVDEGLQYFGKVKYYGPTMGKTTASKTNPDLVDFDDFTREAKEALAKKLNIPTRVLQSDPKYALSYLEMLEKLLDSWRRNPLNANKTLVISKKGLADKNIYNNEPSIPDRQTFVQRLRNRGETDDTNSNDWYNMLLKQNPNLRIDNRFVSDIEYNPHYINFKPTHNKTISKSVISDSKTGESLYTPDELIKSGDFARGKEMSIRFFDHPVVLQSYKHNQELAKRLGITIPDKNASEVVKLPVKVTYKKLDNEIANVAQSHYGDPDAVITMDWSMYPLKDLRLAVIHENLHRGFYSAPLRLPAMSKEYYNNVYIPEYRFWEWKTKKLLKPEYHNGYLADIHGGEAGTNFIDLGRDLGLKLGLKYPGYEAVKAMLENYKGFKRFMIPLLNDSKAGMRHVWDAMTGKYFTPTTVGIGTSSLIHSDKKGSKILIKKENRGKFTEYCGGEVTDKCILKAKKSGNSKLVKRAVFALNARKWKHANGGVFKYLDGTSEGGIQRSYIGGSTSEARKKYFNWDTELSLIISNLAASYNISPNLVFDRLSHEGLIDELIRDNNFWVNVRKAPNAPSFTFSNRYNLPYDLFGLDNIYDTYTKGITKTKRPINIEKDSHYNESGELVNSGTTNSFYDTLELFVAELASRRNQVKLLYPNLTDMELDSATAARYNATNKYFKQLMDSGEYKTKYPINVEGINIPAPTKTDSKYIKDQNIDIDTDYIIREGDPEIFLYNNKSWNPLLFMTGWLVDYPDSPIVKTFLKNYAKLNFSEPDMVNFTIQHKEGGEINNKDVDKSSDKSLKRMNPKNNLSTKEAALLKLKLKRTKPFGLGLFGGGGAGTQFSPIQEELFELKKDTLWVPILESYNDAFANARKKGLKTFMFNGELKNTELGNDPKALEAGAKRFLNIGLIPVEYTKQREKVSNGL